MSNSSGMHRPVFVSGVPAVSLASAQYFRAYALALLRLMALVLFSASAARACEKIILVQVEHDPPLTYLDAGKAPYGMDVELAQAILSEAGCKLKWLPASMSGARTLRGVQDGEFDILLNASDVPERHAYSYVSQTYRDEIIGAFVRPNMPLPKLNTLDDVYAAHLHLIAPLHGWYGEAYQRLQSLFQARGTLATYKEPMTGLQLLFAEPSRGDVLLIDADAYYYWLAQKKLGPVIWLMPPVNIAPTHMMLSRKSVSNADYLRIDAAIGRLQANGSLKRIETKYRSPEIIRLIAASKIKHN